MPKKNVANKKTENIEKPVRLSFNDEGFKMLNVDQGIDVWEKINLQQYPSLLKNLIFIHNRISKDGSC